MVNPPYVLKYQVPGGMFSNLISQLKEMNALDKLDEVLEEIPRVREDLGWPPLVTPTSQIVGTQAVLNVLFGRYERITQQVKDYVKGLYGRPPAEINPEVKKKILGDEEPITVRPADLLEPMLEKCRKELEEKGYTATEEDVLTYCLFPQVALEFFDVRKEGRKTPEVPPTAQKFKLYVDGVEFEVGIEGIDLSALRYLPPDSKRWSNRSCTTKEFRLKCSCFSVSGFNSCPPRSCSASFHSSAAGEGVVTAPMPGKILRVLVKEGEQVKTGQGLLILEAMKMENEIPAPKDGVVKKILVKEGDTVNTGDPLIEMG